MKPYVNLDAVLPFIPATVVSEVGEAVIESWAYQAYRDFRLAQAYDMVAEVVTVENHRAPLSPDIVQITGAWLSPDPIDPIQIALKETADGRRLIAYQEILFSSPWYQQSLPLRYRGQMRSAIVGKDLYCPGCEIGFTVDAKITCLHIDVESGTLLIVYYTPARDESGHLLIVDDNKLLRGLGEYAQARFWEQQQYADASSRGSANELMMQYDGKSQQNLNSFQGNTIARAMNPDDYEALMIKGSRINWRLPKQGAFRRRR